MYVYNPEAESDFEDLGAAAASCMASAAAASSEKCICQAEHLAALRRFPNYHPALAGVAQTAAAQSDWKTAISYMQRARAATPLPDYSAALYDYYTAAGDIKEAFQQKEIIQVIDQIGQAAQEKANRNIALIYADHDWLLDRVLELAKNELDVRGDIYTYDALAWALYKNKQYAEAGVAMKKALRLGTPEPAFYYHAGLIDSALGRKDEAREMLKKALALNPHFDAKQALLAHDALQELS